MLFQQAIIYPEPHREALNQDLGHIFATNSDLLPSNDCLTQASGLRSSLTSLDQQFSI